jgi:acyl-CoA synthetase (AMP-forming)/AMP-acid ligase II
VLTGTVGDAALDIGSSWWDLIERRARLTPDRTMLADGNGRSLTFEQYRARAEATAAGLAGMGMTSDQIVSWQLPTSLEAVVLKAALCRLGVAQNPMIPMLRRAEVGLIVEQLQSDWFIVPGTWRGFDYTALGREVIGDGLCQLVSLDVFDDTLDGIALPAGDPGHLDPPVYPTDAVRWYFYSSGTTAAPKGAKHTDASAMCASHCSIDHVRLGPDDVFPLAFPTAHIGGIMNLTAQMRAGSRVVLFDGFDPTRTPELMADHGATLLGSAIPFFLAYMDAQRRHGDTPLFPKLRTLVAGGAPVPPEIHLALERQLGTGVINQWGLTEFPGATGLAIDDPAEKFLGSVGTPVRNVEVRVVDADGVPVPTGVEGELVLRGPNCFAGYVDSSLDAAAFDADGFFRTGDLGKLDADGFVWVTGRLKDIIIRNAENISALEIEDVLYKHPSIADVAVVGVPDPRTGERCCAVVVLAPEVEGLTLADLGAHCRASGLATQKIPEQIEIVTELPRNATGKILKHVLRAQLK